MSNPRALCTLNLALLIFTSGCFIQPVDIDETLTSVSFALSLPDSSRNVYQSPVYNPFDAAGIYHLNAKTSSKFVRVALVVEDYEIQKATWPDPETGLGPDGDGAEGQVYLSLDVPAGVSRRFQAVAFVAEEQNIITYREEKPLIVDIAVGASHELELNMVKTETGNAEVTLICDSTVSKPTSVALVDALAQVMLPEQSLVETTAGSGTFGTTITSLPVNRPFWLRLYLSNSTTQETTIKDIRAPLLRVTSANETLPYKLVIPCN